MTLEIDREEIWSYLDIMITKLLKDWHSYSLSRYRDWKYLHEQKVEEPESSGRQPGKFMFEVIIWLLFERELLEGGERGELGPDAVVGSPQQVNHELDLVYFRFPRQQRLVGQQLTQYTARAPHINGCGLGSEIM